jgi:hypothetical protein
MKLAATTLGAAVVVVAVAAVASPRPAAPTATKVCSPAFAGPKVTIPWKNGKKSGSHYLASVRRDNCSRAISFTKKFFRRHSAGTDTKLSGGPTGYTCKSLVPKGYTVFQGSCNKGKHQGFVWLVKEFVTGANP